MDIKIDETLDCKGLSCPMPMMKLAKAIKGLNSGEILEMLGTDPGTKSDLPKWSEKTGNTIVEQGEVESGVFRFLIQKK
ncbi:MAG: sulfurtransferase TusA family protein [Bacteroidales bacterium]|nr:sulfurtransferase TusA family protein [Bacteroidales bacterium]